MMRSAEPRSPARLPLLAAELVAKAGCGSNAEADKMMYYKPQTSSRAKDGPPVLLVSIPSDQTVTML